MNTLHKAARRPINRFNSLENELIEAETALADWEAIIEAVRSRQSILKDIGRAAILKAVVSARREQIRLARLHLDTIPFLR